MLKHKQHIAPTWWYGGIGECACVRGRNNRSLSTEYWLDIIGFRAEREAHLVHPFSQFLGLCAGSLEFAKWIDVDRVRCVEPRRLAHHLG
jgi:hypothetical protein